MASGDKRLYGDPTILSDNAPAANTPAVVTFAAAAGLKNSLIAVCFSTSGTTPAVARATIVFTKGGVVTTFGIQLPAVQGGPVFLNFGSHPIEGDVNTAITITLPAQGATQTGEVWAMGYSVPE